MDDYLDYMVAFPTALGTVWTCRENRPDFRRLLDAVVARMPPNSLGLEALLLEPVQRLPRYEERSVVGRRAALTSPRVPGIVRRCHGGDLVCRRGLLWPADAGGHGGARACLHWLPWPPTPVAPPLWQVPAAAAQAAGEHPRGPPRLRGHPGGDRDAFRASADRPTPAPRAFVRGLTPRVPPLHLAQGLTHDLEANLRASPVRTVWARLPLFACRRYSPAGRAAVPSPAASAASPKHRRVLGPRS